MSSPKVTYRYANGSANTIRPESVTYPDGRVLTYAYGSSGGMNDKLSRVKSLGFDGTSNLVQPSYLGLGTQVRTSYSEPDVRWDLITGSSPNPYAGLDRFGRVIDNKWTHYASNTTLDQIKYGYDRASNRIWRENTVAKTQTTPKYFDELYGYDGSNRLIQMERGQLAGSPPSSVTNKQFAQDWGLDPTGNWKLFKEDDNGDGTWDLNQTRTSNPVNEITAINETAGASWVTPGYDSEGNMTTLPRPADPSGDFTGIYDAWNRLVELRGLDDTVVGRYEYDGLTRRVVKRTFPLLEDLEASDSETKTEEDRNGQPQAHRRDYYYNSRWQILEERVGDDTSFDRQYVWGLRYIDELVFRDRQLASSVERNYALQDANWNVTGLTDANGVVVERYSYSAYGVATFLNPDFTPAANQEAFNWDVLYSGYKWDPESALYQIRFRYLHPVLGGWCSRDPIGYRAGNNLYVAKMMLNNLDPSGLDVSVQDCQSRVDGFLASNINNFKKHCADGKPNDIVATCIQCRSRRNPDPAGGTANCSKDRRKIEITICADTVNDMSGVDRVMNHEYQHAKDICGCKGGCDGLDPPTDKDDMNDFCRAAACRELRACKVADCLGKSGEALQTCMLDCARWSLNRSEHCKNRGDLIVFQNRDPKCVGEGHALPPFPF